VAIDGVVPLAPSFDVVGWFARGVSAFSRVGRVLLGEDGAVAPPGLLLRASDAFAPLEAAAAEALEPAIGTVASQLETEDEVQVAPVGLTAWFKAFRTLQAGEIWQSLGGWVEAVWPTLGPGVAERIAWASTVTSATRSRPSSATARCVCCASPRSPASPRSIFLATLEGMPLGLSLVGPRGSDRALVELSASVMASAPSRPSPTVVG
jgi:amidase